MPFGVFKSEHWHDFAKCQSTETRVIFIKHNLNHPTSSPTFNSLSPRKASLVAQTVKNLPACRRPGLDTWVGKIPWRKEWLPTPIFLPGEFHVQRSLAGYRPWGCKQSNTNEQLTPRKRKVHSPLLLTLPKHYLIF